MDDEPRAEDRAKDQGSAPPGPETAYDLLQRGQALLADHHHAQAAIVLERADRLEPRRSSILEALGRAYFNSGQHEAARATFERLLEIDPTAHYAHFALCQSLKKLSRPQEAGTHLRLAVAMDPRSELYRGALARLGPQARPPRPDASPADPPSAPADPPSAAADPSRADAPRDPGSD
jgi:tetratricopeptide (TPR) repeat protein